MNMKSIKKYIWAAMLVAGLTLTMSSCSKDEPEATSIFPEGEAELDPTSSTYKLDKWLQDNYLKVYNLEFRYKMQDVGTNMNYDLVPASYNNARDLAVLAKYLWFECYDSIAEDGIDFLKANAPRIIHLIGSPAYNPTSGTMILGLAEGGIKVSLFRVNQMDIRNFEMMNEYYFKTMHHEFSHILHQKKSYPTVFNTISAGHYDSSNWQDRQTGYCNSLGFVTNYASDAYREDFAETMANFIVKTDDQWAEIMKNAARGWMPSDPDDPNATYYCYFYYRNNEAGDDNKVPIAESGIRMTVENSDTTYYKPNDYQFAVQPFTPDTIINAQGQRVPIQRDKYGFQVGTRASGSNYYALDTKGARIPIKVYPVPDEDGADGVAAINQKVEIVRSWLREAWGIDLDALRKMVQYRQKTYNIEDLRRLVD